MSKKIKVEIFLKEGVLRPSYATYGSVAFDLGSSQDLIIKPKEVCLVPTGLIIRVPKGYFLMLAARSSTPLKKGLVLLNGIGVIDQDFCGPEDEIKLQVFNYTDSVVQVKKGERLAQGIFVPFARALWKPLKKFKNKTRGGFGSTGL